MSDARAIANLYRQRAALLDDALRRGMRRALVAVDAQASRNLSGSGEAPARSYPIPVRTGFLRRAGGVRQVSATSGLVFNRARYARAIHTDGFKPYGNPRAATVDPRPFLQDAVDKVDPASMVFGELRRAVLG